MKFDINQPLNFYKDIQNNVYQILTKDKTYNGVNEHGVPADKLEQMKNRFQIKL